MATFATFHEALAARSDEELAALLALRPDLAMPAPASIAALAARASSRPSSERALAQLDAFELQVLESVVALATPTTSTEAVLSAMGADGASGSGKTAEADSSTGSANLAASIRSAVDKLSERALLWAPEDSRLRPAPTLIEILGPYPAGLGPTVAEALAKYRAPRLAGLADDLDAVVGEDGELAAAIAKRLTDAAYVKDVIAQAPDQTKRLLDALTWGPPVGEVEDANRDVRIAKVASAVDWLLARGLLASAGANHVVLPREIGLILRDGRTHREIATEPPVPTGRQLSADHVAADAALMAAEFTRWVSETIRDWSENPPQVLRSGGLGLRDIKRLARILDASEPDTVGVVELARAAGLIVDDGAEDPHWLPTPAAEEWLTGDVSARWASLALAWLESERTPWLVGTRDTKGELRPALHPDLERPWAARLRVQVLDILAKFQGTALGVDDVLAQMAWVSPRAVPPGHVVEAILDETRLLGLTGAGAAAPTAPAVLAHDEHQAATVLETALPPMIDDVLIQADLTAVVPGRPSADLGLWLDLLADIESRGAAAVYRFTESSVRRGLDSGRTPDELLAGLASHSRTSLPQPLDYLVRDEARRHGQLRVGAASAYLRSEDPSIIAGIAADPAMAPLGIMVLAPTVAACQMPPGTVLEFLKSRGLNPVVEGPDGKLVIRLATSRTIARGVRGHGRASVPVSPVSPRTLDAVDRAELVAAMREGEDRTSHSGPRGTVPTSDPSIVMATLREAVENSLIVEIVVAGTDGAPRRRKVKPTMIDGGRLRALDLSRGEEEISVVVHRIGSVSLVQS